MAGLLVINCFDWSGSRSWLMGWVEVTMAQCEKHGVRFMGLYRPSQVKFNWAMVFEAESQEQYNRTWREATIPTEITHTILHYLWPEETFSRDLPRYPPPYFLKER